MKFLRNLIIVIVGLFIALFLLGRLSDKETPAPEPIPETPTPTETALTSLKGVIIYVDAPLAESEITSPLTITGRAPGNWFFEASAPVTLTDWDGLIIAEGHLNAVGEWMTTDYVPFTGMLTFTTPPCTDTYCKRGSLILQKDNASGEPQFDDSVEMTVMFR